MDLNAILAIFAAAFFGTLLAFYLIVYWCYTDYDLDDLDDEHDTRHRDDKSDGPGKG